MDNIQVRNRELQRISRNMTFFAMLFLLPLAGMIEAAAELMID